MIVKWQRIRKQNHWLDAIYNASAAGYYCGVRLVEEEAQKRPRRTLSQMAAGANVGDR